MLRTVLGPSGKTCGAERQLHRQANLCVAFAGVFGSVRQLWSVSCSFSRCLCCGQCGVPFLHCKLFGRVLPSMMVSWPCLIMSLRCPATVAFCGFDLVLLPSCVLFGKRDFKPRGRPVASHLSTWSICFIALLSIASILVVQGFNCFVKCLRPAQEALQNWLGICFC